MRASRRSLSRRSSWSAVALAAAALGLVAPLAASAAPSSLEVTTPFPNVSVQPGATVTFDVNVAAPRTESVTLDVGSKPEGWGITMRGGGFIVGGVTAEADKPGSVQMEVKVPDDAKPGSYTFDVRGLAGTETSELPITVKVDKAAQSAVEISTDFPQIKGKPTDTFTYDLTLRNNTPQKQVFNFDAKGPDGWEVNASPSTESRASTLSVEAGATGTVHVEAKPPASIAAGTYPIRVVVANKQGESANADLAAVVTGASSMKMATSDGRLSFSIRAGGTTSRQLVVTNDGSASLDNVTLTATPPSDWNVTFDPATIGSIEAGKTANVTMKLRPAKGALPGDYSVTAVASAGTTTANSELRVTVKQSRWWGLAGVALVLAALGVLGIVFRRYGRR